MDIAAELDPDLDLNSQNILPTSYQAIACRARVPFLPWRGATPGHGGACPTLVRPDPASNVRQCHLCMGVARTELRIGAYSDKTPKNCHQRDRNGSPGLALLQTFRSASS